LNISIAIFIFVLSQLTRIQGYFNCDFYLGPSWSWSYGSLIYKYLCNHYLSPLTLWVWIPLWRYNIMW